VATLEKRQWQLKDPRFTDFEFKFLPTLRRWATRPELCLAFSKFGLLSDNNPSPTSGTRDARARNAISHSKIILRLEQRTVDSIRMGPEIPAFSDSGNFVAVRTLGGGPCDVLGSS
jgi:hypothetical protein